jgi:hypothetical protein
VIPIDLASVDLSYGQLYTAIVATRDTNMIQSDQLDIPVSSADGLVVQPVSLAERASLVRRAHLAGHFGGTAMYKGLLLSNHRWPGLLQDCQRECLECIECQKFNITRNGYRPHKSIHADLPFDHVACDLAGPFPPSSASNHTFLLVVVDVCTRFVFLRTLPDKTDKSVANALFKIFCDVGFPKIIQSDNGREFSNQRLTEFCRISNISPRLITPYNPQSNGIAERNVGTAKAAIFKLLKGREQSWEYYVPQVQFFMNTKVAQLHAIFADVRSST